MRQILTPILIILSAEFCSAQLSTADSILIGKTVYNIELINQDGDKIRLKKYHGKHLYIDFWFTGCKSCIKEFPFAKQLKAQMKQQNIVFVNISFDIQESMWNESIQKFEITGDNLWIGTMENHQLLRNEFNVMFFPKYWIVNPDGKIVNPSAGRPSMYVGNDYLKNEMYDDH